METLPIAPGTLAVHAERLVLIVDVAQQGYVTVRDLASGVTRTVAPGELSARTTPLLERRADRLHADVVSASPARTRAAERRERAVLEALTSNGPLGDAVVGVAIRHHIGQRTLWRWIARYRAWPSREALLLEKRGVADQERRLSESAERIINESIDAVFLTQPRGTYVAVCEEVWRRCSAAAVPTPSRNAIVRRIKALDPWIVARAQLGRAEADRKMAPKPGSLREHTPLALVQIDHTLVDLHVVDDEHRQSIGRPWITIAIDVATRCVLGFHLSLEAFPAPHR